jgi:antitoxin component of MazEF toxin-antitoxin module
MGWGQPFATAPEHRTRADLTRELDVALHGEQTITHPVTSAKWADLLAEVERVATSTETLR